MVNFIAFVLRYCPRTITKKNLIRLVCQLFGLIKIFAHIFLYKTNSFLYLGFSF